MATISYPTQMQVQSPDHYDRAQVVLRVLIACGLGALQQRLGGMFGVLYFVLPALAAILITQRSGRGYLERDGSWLSSALEWLMGLQAYMLFVTDRFPLEPGTRPLRLTIEPRGEPSLADALLRLLTSLPHAILLGLLSIPSFVASLIMAVTILIGGYVPSSLRGFQQGLLGWTARALAYHSSLVDAYPPFSLGLRDGQPPQAGPSGPAAATSNSPA